MQNRSRKQTKEKQKVVQNKLEMVLNILIASTVIKSTFGVVTTSLWLIPLMLAAISYYRYDRVDPESRPIDQQVLNTHYDFIVVGMYL